MKSFISKIFAAAFIMMPAAHFAYAETSSSSGQYYKYAHNDAEYSVMLPEAPTVATIWGGSPNIPFIRKPPKDGALGEVATFKRVDIETEDSFEVKITFLKENPDYLLDLTEEKMKTTLQDVFKDAPPIGETFTFSKGTSSLKWATITGFTVDRDNRQTFNAIHYLTGQESILVIQVWYSLKNKVFQEYYKNLIDSVTYLPM